MIGCLMLHGFTGSPREIKPLHDYLHKKTDWKIDVPTLKGHGKTFDLTGVSYTDWLEQCEKAYKNITETCDTVYVIGFSMGGMIAAYLAATFPVEKLVLLAPARKVLSFKYLSIDFIEMIEDKIKGELDENERYVHVMEKIREVPVSASIEFMKLVNYTKDYLPHVNVPVFVAQGKRDDLVPYQTMYTLEEEIGSEEVEIVFFDEADHFICLGDNAPVINELVYHFLTKEQNEQKNH